MLGDPADVGRLLHHAVHLGMPNVEPENARLTITLPALSSKEALESLATTVFESCRVQSLCLISSAVASLYATGRGLTTGAVVESGDGLTCVSCVVDGRVVPQVRALLSLSP